MRLFAFGLCLAALVFIGLSAPALALDEDELRARYGDFTGTQTCNEDSDCIYLANACGGGAINKRFKSRAENALRRLDADMKSCRGAVPGPEPKVYCAKPEIRCAGASASKKCFARTGQCSAE